MSEVPEHTKAIIADMQLRAQERGREIEALRAENLTLRNQIYECKEETDREFREFEKDLKSMTMWEFWKWRKS